MILMDIFATLEMLQNDMLAAGILTEWAGTPWLFRIRLYTPLFQLTSSSSVAQGFILAVFSGKLLHNMEDPDKTVP